MNGWLRRQFRRFLIYLSRRDRNGAITRFLLWRNTRAFRRLHQALDRNTTSTRMAARAIRRYGEAYAALKEGREVSE